MSGLSPEEDPQRAPDRPFELREAVDAESVNVDLLVEGERLFLPAYAESRPSALRVLLGVLDDLSS
jgi:hypothetical protein